MTKNDPCSSKPRNSTVKPRHWLAFAAGIAACFSAHVASADGPAAGPAPPSIATMLQGTPFDSGANAAALPKLAQGATIRRTSEGGTLTPDDRFRLRGLGLPTMHSAAVVLHEIPRTDAARQVARLRTLARSLDQFAPSDVCDHLVATGDSRGLCTGHVDGGFGKVSVRMPVAAKLTEGAGGSLRLVVFNPQPMEAKPLFGWSEIVPPGGLKLAYDLFPTEEGWLVYTRVGVQMSAHEGSAKTISEALLKLESWLTRELARS
jgi:hypothetical protein